MTIRKATFEETQKILSHKLEVMQESTMGHVEQNTEKANQIMGPILAEGGYYLVHENYQLIQGWIGVGTMYDFYTDKTVGIIPELYVLQPYRNQGIAQRLFKEAFYGLKREGVRKVQLNVFAGNHAKNIYEKLGFYDVSTLMEKEL